ncbi:MAG: beta-propeller domain-containing protein [Candidatus ainarchaeum sp.]|nr:beta-propeller domain-containing protein [Candidatus ainarchaeum sp.]
MENRTLFIFSGLVLALLLAGCIKPGSELQPLNISGIFSLSSLIQLQNQPNHTASTQLPHFASCSALKDAFSSSRSQTNYYGVMYDVVKTAPMAMMAGASAPNEANPAYSTTNVQVAGVDEADLVKTDGKYIYSLSNNRIHIVDAYPAENAEEVSSISPRNGYLSEFFVNGDTLAVFGSDYSRQIERPNEGLENIMCLDCQNYYSYTMTTVQLWNISDRAHPKLAKTVEVEGSYLSARMINSTAYFVTQDYSEPIPLYREYTGESESNFSEISKCADIAYMEPLHADSYIIVGAVSLDDYKAPVSKEITVGSGEDIYSSAESLYVAEVDYNYRYTPVISEINSLSGNYEESEKTIVHKFSLSGSDISYAGSMEAPGHILNQFSMDEFNGTFRIATTIGQVSPYGDSTSSNNVYIFDISQTESDGAYPMAGKLENLAPGEKIYSARFMGNRAYLVTFKKVDPLFVIDLSDSRNPQVLGKLKIPGCSDYLHPIDENHIIGIGKDTVEAEEGNFAWYQGIKMAVFDVSNVSKPKEMYKTVIGDRGTDSYALQDHRAFLYDRNKDLLVIPVLLAEIDQSQYEGDMPANTYGDYVFQGAYVYNLTLDGGFQLKGRITHMNESDFNKYGYYYYDNGDSVKRSLYIGNTLYTISDNKIMANSLDNLELVKEVELD